MDDDLRAVADADLCYLTTIGRVSGKPREIEIWFALAGRRLYMLAGGREHAHWVKNLRRNPAVTVRIGTLVCAGRAQLVADPAEDAQARRLVLEKYQPRDSDDLSQWGRTALPVGVELLKRLDT
jgi:deazaflavin-dependent oxidoreductase (nitroreductase family)